ncbi:MAG: hypothetical protein E6G89_04300 [Alphaproteobacteria bacterium]|nr:MAG: hypothetical protein E6G89_04300 [Alphaproteobacteria bacterium]
MVFGEGPFWPLIETTGKFAARRQKIDDTLQQLPDFPERGHGIETTVAHCGGEMVLRRFKV